MIWLCIYLAIGLMNCFQFATRGGFTLSPLSAFIIEFLFYLLLWPVQLLFAIFAYVILPVVNWIGERVLP